MTKISIILPSHNRADFISQTIDSCLKQTHKNIELIIVDDYSTDNSVEVIQSYIKKDTRIKLIQNKHNKKLPATLNVGFSVATGDYLTWISDDNMFTRNALEIMLSTLIAEPDIGLVYSDYTTIDANGKIIARIYQEPPEYLPIRDCIGACFLYRSSIARLVGKYNENLFLIEDYEFFLRMGLKTKIKHIPQSFYYYRVHNQSLTQNRKNEIKLAKQNLKKLFAGQYKIPDHLRPIDDLYKWYIEDKSLVSHIKFIFIIFKHPIITLSYMFRNLCRLKK